MAANRTDAPVATGQPGPVITVSGETDLLAVARLSVLIAGQLPAGTLELTIDVSRLQFADTASIRALVLIARTLTERGGRLVLQHPQSPVVQALVPLGADQMLTIQGQTPGEPAEAGSATIEMPS